ncbi:SIMPL domain-containing protein [Sphingomonas sp. RS6]
MVIGTQLLAAVVAATVAAPDPVQAGPVAAPVAVEIVGTGEVEVAPASASIVIGVTGKGKTRADAARAVAATLAQVRGVLKAEKIPASALAEASRGDFARVLATEIDSHAGDDDEAGDGAGTPVVERDYRRLTVSSVAAAEAVRTRLRAIDVSLSTIETATDEAVVVAATRAAKARALRAAMGDADVYAREMGMRVGGVVRISEAGQGLLLPGLQSKLEQAIVHGPKAMSATFRNPDGTTRVQTSIIVTFELVK